MKWMFNSVDESMDGLDSLPYSFYGGDIFPADILVMRLNTSLF